MWKVSGNYRPIKIFASNTPEMFLKIDAEFLGKARVNAMNPRLI